MYDVVAYGEMMADAGRTSAYARALEARIAPGSVVMDIGTGAGLFALLGCRAGAARVYAVEFDDVIQLAREAAAANGFADRIQFVHATTGAPSRGLFSVTSTAWPLGTAWTCSVEGSWAPADEFDGVEQQVPAIE